MEVGSFLFYVAGVLCGALVSCMHNKEANIGDIIRFKEPAIGVTHDENGTHPFTISPGDMGMIMNIHNVNEENQFEIFPFAEVMIGMFLVDISTLHFLDRPSTYELVNVN